MVILGFDIGAAFTPDVNLFETVVRGTIRYFSIYLAYRFPIVRMTEGELMTQLRLNGAEMLAEVKAVYLEGNGEISVILSHT